METTLRLLEWGAVSESATSGEPSGDAWVVRPRGSGALIAVLDALGHGSHAAEAAGIACGILTDQPEAPLPKLVQLCHAALRRSRGIAMCLVDYQPAAGRLQWVAVGNIQALHVRVGPGGRPFVTSMISRGGMIGRTLPGAAPDALPARDHDVLVLATDGVAAAFADDLPPLVRPQAMAERLMRRHRLEGDDAAILAARLRGDPS